MQVFEAVYFDGKTSAGKKVEVELEPLQLVFRNIMQSNGKPYAWNVYRIHRNDFNDSQLMVLRYGSYPEETLEITDPAFIKTLREQYKKVPFAGSRYNVMFDRGFRILALLTLAFITLMAGLYLWGVPKLAEVAAKALPAELEKQLGDPLAAQLLRGEKIDSAKTVHAQRFFGQLTGLKPEQVRVTVVEHSQVNAFAIPGHIVVYKPILEMCGSYAELAGLLAHENAHLQHRHSLRSLFRSLSSYMLLSVIFGDVSGILAVVVENADMLKSMEYGRGMEREADLTGLELLLSRHIDPQGMVRLFQKMRESSGETNMPEFLSTHPMLENRVQYLQKEIDEREFTVQANDSLEYYWQQLK